MASHKCSALCLSEIYGVLKRKLKLAKKKKQSRERERELYQQIQPVMLLPNQVITKSAFPDES